MTIALRANGGTGIGSTTVTPGLPAGMQDGDGCLVWVITKPDTATINVPAGWTAVVDVAGGGGTTGASAGPTRQAVLFREKDASWSTMPAVSVTSGNATVGRSVAFSKDAAATWALAGATGTYGSAAATTDGTVTHGSNPGIAAGDWCAVSYASMDDAPTISNPGTTGVSLAAAGVTFGTIGGNWLGVFGTTTGNDVGGAYYLVPVSSGTATAAPVTAVTWSAVTRGTAAVVRLRETAAAPGQGAATGTFTFTGTATGTRTPKATATGTFTFTGTAVGKRTPKASASGSFTFTGTAVGSRPAKGTAGGSYTYSGTATGVRTPKATASGTYAYTGSATGTAPLVGAAEGTASGSYHYSGTAVGSAPAVGIAQGTAAGTWTYTGTAVGVAPGIVEPPTPQRRIVSAVLTIPTLAADLEVPGSIAATITARTVRADLTIPEARGVLT